MTMNTFNPNDVPSEIGLSRDNIEALVKAYYIAKYRLKPGVATFTFSWQQFIPELVVKIKKG